MELLARGRTFSAFVGTPELATATPSPTPAATPKSTGLATKCVGASTGMHGPFLLKTRPQAARINPRPSPLPTGPRPSSTLPGTPSPTTRAELSEAQGDALVPDWLFRTLPLLLSPSLTGLPGGSYSSAFGGPLAARSGEQSAEGSDLCCDKHPFFNWCW